MDASILIAKFMGPVMLATSFAMLVNRPNMRAIFEDFLDSPGLIFTAGFLALVLGLAIVIFHNHWVAGWPVIITVYGWIALAAGVVRMSFPAVVKKMGQVMIGNDALMIIAALFNTALGAFLTYQGFLA